MPDPASFVSITRLVDTRRSIESRKNIESAIYQTRYVHWRASSTLEISSSRVKRMETIEREREKGRDRSIEISRFFADRSAEREKTLERKLTDNFHISSFRICTDRSHPIVFTTPSCSPSRPTEGQIELELVFHLHYSRGWSIHCWLVVNVVRGSGSSPPWPGCV